VKAAWGRARLDECTEIVAGATPSTAVESYWGGDVCWATPKDLSDLEGTYIDDTPRKLTREGLASCAATVLPAGSVLFSSRAPIGHVAVNGVPMATNQGFKSFIPKPERVVAKFLYWWLRANRRHLESLGNGATFKEVSKAIVSRIEIPLPPLDEQRRIAAVLDKADELRAKRRAVLAELDTLTQSIFLEMFGNPATNSRQWPQTTLGEVAAQKANNGIFKKNHEYQTETSGTVPVVWVEELFRGDALDTSKSRRLPASAEEVRKYGLHNGDILFCRSSLKLDGIAYNNIYEGENNLALFECHIIRLRPNRRKIEPVFLNALMRTASMREVAKSKAKTATMTTIDQQNLGAIPIPLPPLAQQHEFVVRFAEMRRLRKRMEQSFAGMADLFECLQWHAFRGQLTHSSK
jgi:type I restriction enzyme S subunit